VRGATLNTSLDPDSITYSKVKEHLQVLKTANWPSQGSIDGTYGKFDKESSMSTKLKGVVCIMSDILALLNMWKTKAILVLLLAENDLIYINLLANHQRAC